MKSRYFILRAVASPDHAGVPYAQAARRLVQIKKAGIENGWFSKEMVDRAFQGIVRMLNEDQLEKWIENY